MKKKIIILILLLLLVTGCTTDYNLNIEPDYITEEITATIPKSSIPSQRDAEKKYKIENDDQITPFLTNPQYVFEDNDIIYNKTVKLDESNNYIVNLNYKYNFNDYLKSKAYKECFQESYINIEENKTIPVVFKGKFYCLYGDSININITSTRKVLGNNADYINGNTYTWVIDNNNVDNTNIQILFSDEKISNTSQLIYLILVGVLIVVILIDVYMIKNKTKKKKRR